MILLADDCDELRELYATVLKMSGMSVETARDGREALQKASALLPGRVGQVVEKSRRSPSVSLLRDFLQHLL